MDATAPQMPIAPGPGIFDAAAVLQACYAAARSLLTDPAVRQAFETNPTACLAALDLGWPDQLPPPPRPISPWPPALPAAPLTDGIERWPPNSLAGAIADPSGVRLPTDLPALAASVEKGSIRAPDGLAMITVAKGRRAAGEVPVRPAAADNHVEYARTQGLYALILPHQEPLPLLPGRQTPTAPPWWPLDDTRQGGRPMFVARELPVLKTAVVMHLIGRHDALGLLYGYPPCCIAAYEASRGEVEAGADPVYLMMDRTTQPPPFSHLNNFLLREFGFSFLLHDPCTLHCQASIRIAEVNQGVSYQVFPKQGEDIRRTIRLPVLYSRETVVYFPASTVMSATTFDYSGNNFFCSDLNAPIISVIKSGGHARMFERTRTRIFLSGGKVEIVDAITFVWESPRE